MNKKTHDIEELVDRLGNTGLKDERQGEIEELLAKEDLRSYGHLIRETGEVFARASVSAPDTKAAWEQFRKEKIKPDNGKKRFVVWSCITSLAAGIALFLFLKNPAPDAIHPESTQPDIAVIQAQGVTITTESGERRTIGVKQTDSLLTAQGIKIENKSINYRNTEKEELQILTIPRGHDFKITLSDGTEIWLNAESTLKYPSKFNGAERVVELTGEGYFKVAKDKERPFTVHTHAISTRVSGTMFNIRAYRDNAPHVTLIEGKVHVKDKKQAQEFELSPGEDASIDDNGRIVVQSVDTYPYIQWKNGYFYFDDASLEEVIHELERWYNMKFEIRDSSILSRRIHYAANRRQDITKAIENLNALGQEIVTKEKDRFVVGKQ